MHLLSLFDDTQLVLNAFYQNMDRLINDISLEVLKNPHKLSGFKSIVLYGNSQSFIDIYFNILMKNLSGDQLVANKIGCFQNDNEVVYKYSNFHFEYDHSRCGEKYLSFVKTIFNNKPISNSQHIWYIKNLGKQSRNLQLSYTRIIEKSIWSQFWFSSESLTIDKAIKSRSLLINLAWGSDRMYNLIQEMSKNNITRKEFLIYFLCNKKKVSLSFHDEYLDKLLITIEKQPKAGIVIDTIRDYCYKVFHMNIPFTYIAKYTINYMIENHTK